MFSKKMATLILGLSAALLTGCEAEQTEKDMIAEAQFCMDEARDAASASACVSKISGLTSPQAYTLRCAAGFISAQVTSAENLSKALDAMSDQGAGATSMLTVLNFNSPALANQTALDCNRSGQKGLALIGALAKSSTALADAADKLGLGSCGGGADLSACQNSIEQAIGEILQNPTVGAAPEAIIAIGESIQTVYTATCGGASVANSSICSDINEAATTAGIDIATADIEAIGKALLEQWQPTP
ncbi:hypothetical protein EZJ49_15550 [Bdellovibrio bacteriovorus]|uniref:hypothetical protein n=1 Tax=Bdellovibrio bacteriovorus TaxID=959 RepID=UPI0021CE36D1|nr:hypothetical protein [Bdellovibrio bacteriovorus]UXR64483.1 hypothetical protein EZJ49_15550 [Bdellovibrio bacteriovorus]